MAKFKKNQKVIWKWLGRNIAGQVQSIYEKPITKEIKGKSITRLGSKEKPAYLVQSEAGNLALKLETELSSPPNSSSLRRGPKMFKD